MSLFHLYLVFFVFRQTRRVVCFVNRNRESRGIPRVEDKSGKNVDSEKTRKVCWITLRTSRRVRRPHKMRSFMRGCLKKKKNRKHCEGTKSRKDSRSRFGEEILSRGFQRINDRGRNRMS